MVKHQGEVSKVKFKILKRANPLDREKELYYPAPVFGEQIGEDELTEEISYASSVNQSDVRSILSNLLEILPRHLMHGDSVNLEKFGIFRLSFESTGSENENDVSAQNITRPKVLFRPSTKLKDKISKTSFVRQ